MIFSADGWTEDALWVPGPEWKQGYGGVRWTHQGQGEIKHSMVGAYTSALGHLTGPDQASWHFSIRKSGLLIQHYPLTAVCWHGGGPDANARFVGVEHEGGPLGPAVGEPLTEAQHQATLALTQALAEHLGYTPARPEPALSRVEGTLWEHNEMTRFGSAPTACPSGRIPWGRLLADLQSSEEENMKLTLIGSVDWGTVWIITPEGRKTPIVSVEHFNILFDIGLIGPFDENRWDDIHWVTNELADLIPDAR